MVLKAQDERHMRPGLVRQEIKPWDALGVNVTDSHIGWVWRGKVGGRVSQIGM